MKRFVSTKILFCLLGFIEVSCFNPFAPELNNEIDLSNVITEQQSPEEVLQNFQFAYTFKDSLLYSDVLDESFVFEFFDTNLEPSGGLRTWSRDVDLKTTGSLFRTFDVINLIWLNTLFEENDGELERRFLRFNLNLFSSNENFIVTGTAIFTFRKSSLDNKWRLVRWKDESDF